MEHSCNSRRFQSNRYRANINSSSPLVRHSWSFTVSECGLVVVSTGPQVLLLSGFCNASALSWSGIRTPPPSSNGLGSYSLILLGWMGEGGGEHSVAISWLVRNSPVIDRVLCVHVFVG